MSHSLTGDLVLPDRVLPDGTLVIEDGRIVAIHEAGKTRGEPTHGYIAPGFIDIHVHGGGGADFMDGTAEAFTTACRAHARHGTTSLLATTTAASHERCLRFLRACRELFEKPTGGAAVAGAHFYGPYFAEPAKGCHPAGPIRPPAAEEYAQYLAFADVIRTATVAPELPGAEAFVRACRRLGICCTMGHSFCTFDQAAEAIRWGVSHADHLFCAMSDRARLRQSQLYPMRGGLMEAVLYFDELTTEVIADGKHLAAELLRLAYKCKGPDRLALVTDSSRALGMPDGEYLFGPVDAGEPILKKDGVGVMPDGKALASGVVGMDHLVRTMLRATGAPLHEVVRMASSTPARIAGLANRGSLEAGQRADLVVLDTGLVVQAVYVAGERVA
jgi:N-acetylglucosamine-6-phosphate deacetylase